MNPLDFPALVCEKAGRLVGVLTYIPGPERCEILTLHVAQRWRGTGTALISRMDDVARELGCSRLFLITTNDNLDALRFYQRRGFRLASLYCGAVEESRTRLKPELPPVGDYGIPLRDEIELEKEI